MTRAVAFVLLVVLVAACGQKEASEYIRRSKETAARLMLTQISRTAREIVDIRGALPAGTIGPTPSQPCCGFPDHKCPVDVEQWRQPIWESLQVSEDFPGHFQYSYQSDGQSFTATATGDTECDGKVSTFTITGAIGANKQLVVDESQVESAKNR